MTQLYLNCTFMGASVGLEYSYTGSPNLNSGSKFQHASPSVKMLALLPTYLALLPTGPHGNKFYFNPSEEAKRKAANKEKRRAKKQRAIAEQKEKLQRVEQKAVAERSRAQHFIDQQTTPLFAQRPQPL